MTRETDRTRRPFELGKAIAMLSRTPRTLDVLLRGVPRLDRGARGRRDVEPFDVIGHLVHGEHTDWTPASDCVDCGVHAEPSRRGFSVDDSAVPAP